MGFTYDHFDTIWRRKSSNFIEALNFKFFSALLIFNLQELAYWLITRITSNPSAFLIPDSIPL